MKLEWQFSNYPAGDISSAIVQAVSEIAHQQMPDLADMFPFQTSSETLHYLDEGWMAVRITHYHTRGVASIGSLEGDELEEIRQKIQPFTPRSHAELFRLLGPSWFSSERFTYVGPYQQTAACWPDLLQHLVDWLNHLVVREVMLRNQARVLRAIPSPPQFDLSKIRRSLWVLECEEVCNQGTAFALSGVGLITCHHVLGRSTQAFRPDAPSEKYQVRIRAANEAIDLAVLDVEAPPNYPLEQGTADNLKQMDHIAVAGFPNYRIGDTGVFIPGLVVGFRVVSGIRRILTNAPIVAGNSGGPVLDSGNRVIGIAVTGADSMSNAQQTENHGVIPIDALNYLAG